MPLAADVTVIGGGVIGCSVAYCLAEAGAAVVLVEKNELAHGASGRNHGLIFYPQNDVTEPLYRRSQEIYSDIADSSDIDISLDRKARGLLILVKYEYEWAAAEKEARSCEPGGVEIEQLGPDQVEGAVPELAPGFLGGWFIDDGYLLDPAALTAALANGAAQRGATIKTHTEAKQIVVRDGRVRGVATDEGVIESRVVVDAAGPWATKLARAVGVELPIVGARGWLMLTRPVPRISDHILLSPGWHVTSDDPGSPEVTLGQYADGSMPPEPDVGLLIQQHGEGNVLLGGSRISSMREDPEGPEVTRQIAARAVAAVPTLKKATLTGIWSGVRPMSRDGRPIIGWVEEIEGLFIAGGHGGQGVIMGGGTGALAAGMITGEPFTDPLPFSPSRTSLLTAG